MDSNVLFAFTVTLFAGLATGIGSVIAFASRRMDEKFLSFALGFSAGVMIYVSMIEIFFKAKESLVDYMGAEAGYWVTTLSFFGGIVLIAVIDTLVPSFANPHEVHSPEEMSAEEKRAKSLYRMGLFSALAIAIHNFPEGLATFTSTLQDPGLGVPVAIAIAIHNIPEGIAVSVPIFYATKSKGRAFRLSFLSGLSEPVGAAVGYGLFAAFFNDAVFGILFGAVAGIMVFISLDELLPTAEKYGEHHIAIYGVVMGMAVMAVSLLLFA